MKRKEHRIIPKYVNFDEIAYPQPFFDYTIDPIKKLTKFSWQVNNQKFTFNSDQFILTYEIDIFSSWSGLKVNGRIRFARFNSSEHPHQSSQDQYIRDANGRKIWLIIDSGYSIWDNSEFWDEKEMEIE